MVASSASKNALDNLYAAVRKEVEEQLASRSAALDRREEALDRRERALEAQAKADGKIDEAKPVRRNEKEVVIANELTDAGISQGSASAPDDESISQFTAETKSETPTGSRIGKLFGGRAREPSPEKGPPMASTGSNGGGRAAQWWERQKDNTKSLVKKVSKGRLSNASINEDNDKSGGAEDAAASPAQPEEEQPLHTSAGVAKMEPQSESSPMKKPPEKVCSLFDDDDDEPDPRQATGSQPSRAPKFSYTSGVDPLSGQAPSRKPPPVNPFVETERKQGPSLPNNLVNLTGGDAKSSLFNDSPKNSPKNGSKASAAVEPSAAIDSTSKQPVGSQPVRSSLFQPVNSQPDNTTPVQVKPSLFEETKRGSGDIDGSNPGSASELRAAFEKRKSSGPQVMPQVTPQKSGGLSSSRAPPPKKSFADLP